MIALATLNLLTDVAAERPVLLVADDVQWLDQQAPAILTFLAPTAQQRSVRTDRRRAQGA